MKAAIAHWRATGERPSRVMVWMPEHAGRFLDHAEAHDVMLYALFGLILHRGLRRGEAIGMRDRDVDAGMRARWQLVNGFAGPGAGDFFVKPDGAPWHPDHVSERFEQLIRDCDLPPIRLHNLRHCAATYLKTTGADMNDIKETLGTPRSPSPPTPR